MGITSCWWRWATERFEASPLSWLRCQNMRKYPVNLKTSVGKSSKQTVDLTNLLFDSQRYHRILWYGKEWNRVGVMGYPLIPKKPCFAGPWPTSIEDTLGPEISHWIWLEWSSLSAK
jgi:hypothetical protein